MNININNLKSSIKSKLKGIGLIALMFMGNGFLKESGWIRSVKEKLPVDLNGKPIPWMTYPFLYFIENRIHSRMTVFEYGSGGSTLWWASRVKKVTSCEHDLKWHERCRSMMPDNVDLHYMSLEIEGNYSKLIDQYETNFDVIVIDGRDRVNCAKYSLKALKPDGVIIWDNSDRQSYKDGFQFLQDNGFKKIDFYGIGPINEYSWCTSVFYRDENCLAI